MSAQVSIFIGEDAELSESVHLKRSGAARSWVHVNGFEAAVWGSPAALRRFARAVVAAADSGEARERGSVPSPVVGKAA